MASCHTLPLEDGHDREPLPWCGGDDQERPADDAAAAALDSVQGVRHAPQRWGLSVCSDWHRGRTPLRVLAPVSRLLQDLYACPERARRPLSAGTVDPGGRTDLCPQSATHDRRRWPSLATLPGPCAVVGTRGGPTETGREHGNPRLGARQHADVGRECGGASGHASRGSRAPVYRPEGQGGWVSGGHLP